MQGMRIGVVEVGEQGIDISDAQREALEHGMEYLARVCEHLASTLFALHPRHASRTVPIWQGRLLACVQEGAHAKRYYCCIWQVDPCQSVLRAHMLQEIA